MIKYFHYFMLGIAATALLSCADEIAPVEEIVPGDETPEVVSDKVPMVFSAALEETDTRSDISGNYILWESTDKIAIFDGTDLNEFSAGSITADGKGADFTGSAAPVETYYAVAPYEAATNLSTANTRISITIPHSQVIVGDHCVDTRALVSTAVASGTTDLSFQNQFSLMKVKLESADIVGISVVGNNDESIAGTSHFYYGGEGAPRVDLSNAGQKQVNLVYRATASSSPSAFPAGEYYIAIWPRDFTKGYTVILTDEDGGKSLKSTSAPQNLGRNGGQNLSTIDNATFCPPVIMTAAQLKMWRRLANAGAYTAGEEVKLGADIDLGGYAWTPVPEFLGIFDGQNHRIYNFTVSSSTLSRVGFIGTLGSSNGEAAVLKNTVFGSSDGTSADGSSSISISSNPESGWTYAGLVAYVHKNARMENVTTFIPVNGLAEMTVKHRIGGLAGQIGNNVTISGCVSRGAVTDRSACTSGEGSSIAGLIGGWGGSDSQILGCSNYATVENYCVGVPYVAGIIAYTMGEGLLIDDCHNLKVNGDSEIANNANSVRDSDKFGSIKWSILTGGIVGVVGADVTVNKCTNTMDIYGISTNGDNYRACVGGIAGGCIRKGSSVKGCSNTASTTRNFTSNAISENKIATPVTAGGIVGFVGNSSDMVVTKADDGTWTTNSSTIAQTRVSNNKAMYYGGIVGLLNSKNAVVSYCRNSGKINSYNSQGSTKATFCGGGICGSALGTMTNCINDGVIFNTSGGSAMVFYSGGICGDTDAPKEISYCVNNGPVSVYSSNGSTATGGIISQLKPGSTVFTYNTNNGLITTGNLNSYPGTPKRNIQNIEVSIGALIGKIVPAAAEATICEGCIVSCDILNAQSYDKWGYCGLVAGEVYSKDSWPYKVTVGSSEDPVIIVNTTKCATGDNGNPANETVLDVITTVPIANKYVMGKKNTLYSSTDGSNDATKLELHLSVGATAQAGIN